MSPSNALHNGGGGGGGGGNGMSYIKHQVSKLDTLAGVAIKYGVEVQVQFVVSMFVLGIGVLILNLNFP